MKTFDIPQLYQSSLISNIKEFRRKHDKLKRDFSPTLLDFGSIRFLVARHFGFCYGVENAIEIAYKTLHENPNKRIFLLSEMIHNAEVNRDLQSNGIRFLMDTAGKQLIPWCELIPQDIVIVPAFGTTIEIQEQLKKININPYQYDTTCPFVEKVWKRAAVIGQKQYTIIVHGKPSHEETRATFSHSKENAPTLVVKDMAQTQELVKYMTGKKPIGQFYEEFVGQFSNGFDITTDLQRIGVVNQTTMLAADTQAIADYLRNAIAQKYNLSESSITEHFADTRDTLCYATNDNQSAVYGLLEHSADIAVVVGGYNSSNTQHLVELCEQQLPTYYIENKSKILSKNQIQHYDFHTKKEKITSSYLPLKQPVTIMLTCGASCPDAIVENVLLKLLSFFDNAKSTEAVMEKLLAN